ncbi:MAG: protein kinase domain-containing protein [Thermoanaerobaculia bacterium]
MPLTAGARLGPYRIDAEIGAGGMGHVFRATDTRLDRAVAIKVLPQHRWSDPETRMRFEREAHALSSLSHPNLCALYDVGELEQSGTSVPGRDTSPAASPDGKLIAYVSSRDGARRIWLKATRRRHRSARDGRAR